jgi:hypothetical protein
MLQHHQKFAVAVIVLAVYMMALVGEGFADDPGIKLVINPSKTDVYLGSGPIALTARVKGKNLEYEWKLLGPGELEGKGSSVFYILPEKIEGDSEQALITVTVKDKTGEEVTESVTFNILPEASSKGTGLSKGAKIGIGVGAAAALGGGIALIAGGGDDDDDDDDGGSGSGPSTLNIMGSWTYMQTTRGVEGDTGDGKVVFSGTATSGTFTIIDNINAVSYQGNYTVNGANVNMSGSDRVWTGVYDPTEGEYIGGVWNLVNNADVGGTWWSWKQSE